MQGSKIPTLHLHMPFLDRDRNKALKALLAEQPHQYIICIGKESTQQVMKNAKYAHGTHFDV